MAYSPPIGGEDAKKIQENSSFWPLLAEMHFCTWDFVYYCAVEGGAVKLAHKHRFCPPNILPTQGILLLLLEVGLTCVHQGIFCVHVFTKKKFVHACSPKFFVFKKGFETLETFVYASVEEMSWLFDASRSEASFGGC